MFKYCVDIMERNDVSVVFSSFLWHTDGVRKTHSQRVKKSPSEALENPKYEYDKALSSAFRELTKNCVLQHCNPKHTLL